jgi:glycosyltransferase involved in cell wall biosynthesis
VVETVQIVIPAYNKAGRVSAAIRSVLAQSFKGWRLTVVDDHSTDGTLEEVKALAAGGIPGLELVQTPRNLGAAGARNFGAALSRSAFLCFLDADDRYEPNFLEATLTMLSRLPMIDAVQTGVITPTPLPAPIAGPLATTLPGNKMLRRYAFETVGGFPAQELFRKGGEDVIFSRLLRRFFNLLQIGEALYHYDAADSPHFRTYLERAQVVDGALQLSGENAQDQAVNAAWPWIEALVKQRLRARAGGEGMPPPQLNDADWTRIGKPDALLLRGSPYAMKEE